MRANSVNPLSDFLINSRTLYITFLASVVGIFGALIAMALTKMIGFFTHLFYFFKLSFATTSPYPNHLGAAVILIPVLGALIIGFMARYGSDKIRGHGIPEAMEAILIGKSIVSPKVAILKPLSAAISIGSGGPFGAEGPIIMSGSSIGSVIGQCLSLTATERKILLLAGAAAGMSATFNAPIAGVLFVLELLAFEMKPRSMFPIAMASGISDFIRIAFIGGSPIFPSSSIPHLNLLALVISIGFGLLGAGIAYILTKAIYGTEDLFAKLPIHWMWWPAIGAVFIGVGGYFVPQVLGVGYDTIGQLTSGQFIMADIILFLLIKSIIWIVALGSGTSGGILAPILIIGGLLGDLLAVWFHAPDAAIWSMLGMASVFAGVTRSPLTAIVFLLELTHDLPMLLPTLITCTVAAGISAIILPRSILTEKIARRDRHIARDYGVDSLELIRAFQLLSTPLVTFMEKETIGAALAKMMHSGDLYIYQNYPIVSEHKKVVGMVSSKELLGLAEDPEMIHLALGDRFSGPVATVFFDQLGREISDQMLVNRVNHVVVLDEKEQPIGMVTSRALLTARKKEMNEESIRKRYIHFMMPRRRAMKRAVKLPKIS